MSNKTRRDFLKSATGGTLGMLVGSAAISRRGVAGAAKTPARRPNILLAISDDQSWLHTGVMGCKTVNTPAFDRVAREGVLFTNAFGAAPQCSPCRAALLTGRHIWQLEEAGTHASNFPIKFQVYPDLIEAAGYFVGGTGKLWGPGEWKTNGRPRNPAGPAFNRRTLKEKPSKGLNNNDYAGNFQDFLQRRPKDKPFCFWYGGTEPHRQYEKGIGLQSGKKIEDVVVPPFLPDVPEIRSDILDYCFEIDWFDKHLGAMLRLLEEAGELDNTIILVTSDNGMSFPNSKANMHEYGTHMPMAIRWPAGAKGGRVVEDLIPFIDIAPTFLEAAGLTPPAAMTGKSFLDVLASDKSGRVDPKREKVLTGRERHTHARPDNVGYPSRAIRTYDYLFILNFKPDRWPAGDPEGYHDIDGSPSKTYMMEHRTSEKVAPLFPLAFGKRPAEELYDIKKDPGCLTNLADRAEFAAIKKRLRAELERSLTEQGDPRMSGSDIFDSYPRYSPMRPELGGFAEQGQYNPKFQPKGEKP
jgi:uncharacterized sulfatase